MKTKQLIAAAVLTLSGAAAFAAGFGDEPYVNYPPTTGAVKAVADTKTPAELQTEQNQAHALKFDALSVECEQVLACARSI